MPELNDMPPLVRSASVRHIGIFHAIIRLTFSSRDIICRDWQIMFAPENLFAANTASGVR
jgi:hypothetical protein